MRTPLAALSITKLGIEDLDAVNQLTKVGVLTLDGNEISSIEGGSGGVREIDPGLLICAAFAAVSERLGGLLRAGCVIRLVKVLPFSEQLRLPH